MTGGDRLTVTAHVHEYGPWDTRWILGRYERRYCSCGAFQARRLPDGR